MNEITTQSVLQYCNLGVRIYDKNIVLYALTKKTRRPPPTGCDFEYLHCALAAAQCIVIGPVCLFVAGWVSVCVCGWCMGVWVGLFLPR